MTHRNLLVCISIAVLFAQSAFAQLTVKTWTGNQNSSWNTGNNWDPNGKPNDSHLVRFVANRPNYPVLSADQEIGGLLMGTGSTYTIDLGGNTLTVLGDVNIEGGNLSNGTLIASNFDDVRNATFNRVTLQKTGAATAHFGGALVFNDSTSIEIASTVPAGTLIYFGDQNGYNFTFNGEVSFRNSSALTSTLYIARDTGLITFKDTVELVNPHTLSTFIFGDKGGTSVLDTFSGFLDADLFITGNLVLRNLIQYNTFPVNVTSPADLTVRGSSFNGPVSFSADNAVTVIRNNTFNNTCNITATNIENLQANIFNGAVNVQKISGGTTDTWFGGNTFNDTTVIINSSLDALQTAFGAGDTFNLYSAFRRFGSGALNVASNGAYTTVFKRDIDMVSTTNAPNFGPGIALFKGDTMQTIYGIGTLDYPFDYITLQNDSNLLLQAPVLVNLGLEFKKGLIFSDSTNLLSFTSAGSYSGSSDSTYVAGPVQKRNMANMGSFTFPVGDTSYYAPIAVEQAMDGPTFTAQYFYRNPDSSGYDRTSIAIGDSIDHVSKAEYWVLDKNSLGGSAYVKLFWADRSGGVTDPSKLLVAHWDTTGVGVWKSEGRGVVTGTNASGTITTQGALTSFSPFTLSSGVPLPANPLPVNLLFFKAIAQSDRTVSLNWATMQEQNNAMFEVERSKDGRQFEPIASVPGAGTVFTQQNYQALDLHPYEGYSYYRLKQTDWDGKYTYSHVESVWLNSNNSPLNVYPNPAGDWLKIEYLTAGDAPERITLYNQAGQPCQLDISSQANGLLLHTHTLPRGIYMLEVIGKGERQTFKVSIL